MKQAVSLHWDSASRTHVGTVRKLNEDSVLERPDRGLWAVADGMGGHAAGDFASAAVVNALNGIHAPASLGALVGEVRQQLQAVNHALSEEARRRGQELIGSTVVVLLLFGAHAVVLWAGDSRAYLYREGELKALTRGQEIDQTPVRSEDVPDYVPHRDRSRGHGVRGARMGDTGSVGPERRGTPDPAFALRGTGRHQSPINIGGVVNADLPALNALIHGVLLPHPAVARVQSQIVMDQLKSDAPLPI